MAKKVHPGVFNREDSLTKREKQQQDRQRIARAFGINRDLTDRDIRFLLNRVEDYQARGLIK